MAAVRTSIFMITLTVLGGCAASQPEATPKPLRIGRTSSNGNCALDSDNKLTGLCVASDKSGTKCIARQPDPNWKPCPVGLAVTETRTAACAGGQSGELASRQHECAFVQDP